MASVAGSPVSSTRGIVYLLIGFSVLQFTRAGPTRVEVTAADRPLNLEMSEYKPVNQKLPELKETENVGKPVATSGPKNESTPDHINKPPLTSSIPRKSSGMSSAPLYAHAWAKVPPPAAMLNTKESDKGRVKEKMMFMEQEPANEFLQQGPQLLIEGPAGSEELFSDSMIKEWLDSTLSRQRQAFPAAPVFDEEPSTLAAIDVSPLAVIKAMTDYLLLTGDMRGLESTIADLVALRAITPEEADFYQLVLEYENIQRQDELNKYFRKNILLNFLPLPNLGFAEYESYDEPPPYLRNPDFNALTLALKSKSVPGTAPETSNEGRQENPPTNGLLKSLEVEGDLNEPKQPLTSKVEFLSEVEQGEGKVKGGKPNPELEKELEYLLGDEGREAARKIEKTKVKNKTNKTPKQSKTKSDVRLTKTSPLKSPKKKPPTTLKISKPEVKHDQPDIAPTV